MNIKKNLKILSIDKKVRGTTLIETLIILAMISFLYIAGVEGYNSFRKYNLATETLRIAKILIKNAKYQTRTIRQEPGEYVYAIGVRLYEDSQGQWAFEAVKYVDTVTYEPGYLPYPHGTLSSLNVRTTVSNNEADSIEKISVDQFLTPTIWYGNSLSACHDLYIFFEVPVGAVHYYCRSGQSLNPLSTGIQSVGIGFTTLGSTRLIVTKLADIYIR